MQTLQFSGGGQQRILEVQIENGDDFITYYFQGEVNEHFKYEDLPLPNPNQKTITFDLKDIKNFNSVGIREWIFLNREFEKKGKLIYRNCSVASVDQFNMVPDSIGNAEIESFFAPYYCTKKSCGKERICLISTSESKEELTAKQAPEKTCEKGVELEFDALEESYFSFLFVKDALKKAN